MSKSTAIFFYVCEAAVAATWEGREKESKSQDAFEVTQGPGCQDPATMAGGQSPRHATSDHFGATVPATRKHGRNQVAQLMK